MDTFLDHYPRMTDAEMEDYSRYIDKMCADEAIEYITEQLAKLVPDTGATYVHGMRIPTRDDRPNWKLAWLEEPAL